METPSSTRNISRSHAMAYSANGTNLPLSSRKFDESEKTKTKSRQRSALLQLQDRSALIDITNDSPIVGVAMGNLQTPSSSTSKKRASSQPGHCTPSPGSGEALLRGQVKTLLQKVEEEAELAKITVEKRPFFNLLGVSVVISPMALVAPTPANTPQVFNHSEGKDGGLPSATPVTEKFLMPQIVFDKKQEVIESENLITRSLMLDFSDKSASSKVSSVLSYQGGDSGDLKSRSREQCSTDDDSSSIWSIQANASGSTKDLEDEEEGEECIDEEEGEECIDEEDYYCEEDEDEEEFGCDNGLLDDLCEGITNINVSEGPKKFCGKHIRFMYNSDDDEIAGEEVVNNGCGSSCEETTAASPTS